MTKINSFCEIRTMGPLLSIPVLSRTELTFFTLACTVPRFGFVRKTVLVTLPCASCHRAVLTQQQSLSCLSSCLAVHLAGDAARPAAPDHPKGYATQGGIRNSNKSWEEDGRTLKSCGICLPKQMLMRPAFLGMAGHPSADGT